MDFLCDSKNKTELFDFLTDKIAAFKFLSNKLVYVTLEQSVLQSSSASLMEDCNHKEADTRIVVHAQHALQQGMKTITVDTNVVVILVGLFYDLNSVQPLVDIWITFGVGKNFRLISINAICHTLREPKSRALPLFHALSSCESAFHGKGKKSFVK